MGGWMEGGVDRRRVGRMGGWMEGGVNGWIDGGWGE